MSEREKLRARFILAAATIERDVRHADLTDDEIDRLVSATQIYTPHGYAGYTHD